MEDVQVVFDIGARDTTYPIEYPEATCHLFEPNPKHAKVLREKFRNWTVTVNEWGIGDKEETKLYDNTTESFVLGGAREQPLLIKTLDSYIENIDRIDLLKVDTEGMDLIILKGNPKAVSMARYIIFEHWDNLGDFEVMLKDSHYMLDIGERNVLCKKKN